MGQFKPMVKMETTEPSVILKLKKGGHVNMKKGGKAVAGHKKMADGGGALSMMADTPALIGRPAVNAPVRAPGRPPMAARRKAMMGRPMMKEGGDADMAQDKAMIKKAIKQHDAQEHKGGKGTKLNLKTGGVSLGNGGGYKKGGAVPANGIIKNEAGAKTGTKMDTAERTTKTSGKTGDVKKGNGGGYATGGVTLSNAGGYKKGGSAKKAYAAGGVVDSGRPVAMPQGRKKPSSPVSISKLSGTFKKGGKVTPAEGRLQKAFSSENATAMKQAKAQSNEVYSKFQGKKMAGGGDAQSERESKGYRETYATQEAENRKDVEDFKKFTNPMTYIRPAIDAAKRIPGAVTEMVKSKTVVPAKKRGGSC
jgi:hypothetical protein